jgi:DNA-binding NarL/FixJ family response regulator
MHSSGNWQPDSPIKVLIVEDHDVTRMGLKMVLNQMEEFEVVGEAVNGEEATKLVSSLEPHVVIMDIFMPVMNGIEATQIIKASHPHVKVLILTEDEVQNALFASLSAGADGYATKDCSTALLASAVTTVASGGIWLDPSVAKEVANAVQSKAPVAGRIDPFGAPKRIDTQFRLSNREMEILQLLVRGLSNQQMAAELGLGSETVKTHMRHIMDKLKVSDRTQAAVMALKHGLVDGHAKKKDGR